MKKMCSSILAVLLMISIAAPCASALAPEVNISLPNGLSAEAQNVETYYDNEGNFVVVETIPADSEPATPFGLITPFTVNNKTFTTNRTTSENVKCFLTGKFEWESGNYVTCYGYSSGITSVPSGWTKGTGKVTTTYGASGHWAKIRYDGTVKTPAKVTRNIAASIEVNRSGTVYYNRT